MHSFHAHKQAGAQTSEAADSVIHWASRYDLLLKLLFLGQEQAVRRRLLEPASIQPGYRVLDVGCGTGTMALAANALAGPTGKVSGIDPSPEMIDVARRKAAGAGADIDFRVGLIQEIPFQDDRFDVVVSSLMFHHLAGDETKRRGLAEIRRVLKPGGRCLIIDFDSPDGPLFHKWARHRRGAKMIENKGPGLVSMLEEAGFVAVERGKLRGWFLAAMSFVRGKAPHG